MTQRRKLSQPIDRRLLLKLAANSGVAAGLSAQQLLGVPWIESVCRPWLARSGPQSFDAYMRLAAAIRLGLPAAPLAWAQPAADGWSLVTIKVLNQVFTPLLFAVGGGPVRGSTRGGAAAAMLKAKGADTLSALPRFAALRFNQWFAELLANGAEAPAALAGHVGPLGDKVALQVFHHLKQIAGQNHALKGTKLRQSLPDLALFAEERQLISSPLGITALMMGGEYDKAEGTVPANAVLGESQSETVVVQSRRVADYVSQLAQYVGQSYVPRQASDDNLNLAFDRIVENDPLLRRELLASVESFKAGLARLDAVRALEQSVQIFDPARGNGQSNMPGKAASYEFLAQCLYVKECLALPGKPLRNFSLFLNINDLDGKDLDATTNQVNPNQSDAAVRAYTYVEGMRQLAQGLNLLGRMVESGEKLLVTVISEGGRGAGMEDSKTSFALVLGPSGPGLLADCSVGNAATFAASPDLAAEAAQVAWDDPEVMRGKSGARMPSTIPSVGDVQMGVVEFLEEQTGRAARTLLPSDEGRYARLKRA